MGKSNISVQQLVEEGNNYNYDNNKKFVHNQYFSEATPNLLSWISKVENYIRLNYDENSGPHKMLETVQKQKFTGYYQSEFETELNKLKGAIQSCLSISPNKKNEDNYIISLIKNPFFWTVIVIIISGSYKLGYDNGISKFDNEKIELEKENQNLKIENKTLKSQLKKRM